MKKTFVFIGNFGSGKSEIAINTALKASATESTVLVDLDIINPYFRSSERKALLNAHGIQVHHPLFAMTGVEAPSIPPDIYAVFVDQHETVVFDVGGDPTGAVALGQYKRNFDSLPYLEVLYVINPMRPLSSTVESIVDMIGSITSKSRLPVTGLVNNANLSNENSFEILLHGYDIVKQVSIDTGIPVRFTVAESAILNEFSKAIYSYEPDSKYIGEKFSIDRYMHRDWERFTENGI
ncbi:MAG: hypothetical protein RRY79_05180 [Clostridia bacterium]